LLSRGYDGANLLTQGITSIVVGNCGVSALPTSGNDAIIQNTESRVWKNPEDYFTELEQKGIPLNAGFLVGQGSIRYSVMGQDTQPASSEEIKAMQEIVREYVGELGFLGVSSGLIYAPGMFTSEQEMIKILGALNGVGGLYKTHLRNEGPKVVKAVQEAIKTADQAGVPLQIAHHKAAGRDNWGLTQRTISLIDEGNDQGMDIGLEVYLYRGAHTSLRVIVPKSLYGVDGLTEDVLKNIQFDQIAEQEANAHGVHSWCNNNWADVYITLCSNIEYSGKTVSNIADELGLSCFQTAVELLLQDPLVKCTLDDMMSEEDVVRVLTHNNSIVAGDALIYDSSEKTLCHPRNYGNIPRLISKYTPNPLSIETAIDKVTTAPAKRYNIPMRGELNQGYFADIVVFDKLVRDRATVQEPTLLSKGVDYVFVNGELCVNDGKLTGARKGMLLR